MKLMKLIECLKNPKFYKIYFNGTSPLFELAPLLEVINEAKQILDVEDVISSILLVLMTKLKIIEKKMVAESYIAPITNFIKKYGFNRFIRF